MKPITKTDAANFLETEPHVYLGAAGERTADSFEELIERMDEFNAAYGQELFLQNRRGCAKRKNLDLWFPSASNLSDPDTLSRLSLAGTDCRIYAHENFLVVVDEWETSDGETKRLYVLYWFDDEQAEDLRKLYLQAADTESEAA